MWQMPGGARVLQPHERSVLYRGVQVILEDLDNLTRFNERIDTGLHEFDALTPEQKYFILDEVTQALTNPTVPPPCQTAANEAVISAIYGALEIRLESEIMEDDQAPENLRTLLLRAAAETDDPLEEMPDAWCSDMKEWRMVLELLSGRILWDADFAAGDAFLDLPPEQVRANMELLGIDPDYFLTVVQEPSPEQLMAARTRLEQLLKGEPNS